MQFQCCFILDNIQYKYIKLDLLTVMTTESVLCEADLNINQPKDEPISQELKEHSQITEPEILDTNQIDCHQQQNIQQVPLNQINVQKSEGQIQNNCEANAENEELILKKLKSQEQLKMDFTENQKILASLSFNIDDLFKKISSLTEQVQSQITTKPASTTSLDKIQLPQKKSDGPSSKSQAVLQVRQTIKPVLEQVNPKPKQQKIVEVEPTGLSMRIFEIGKSLGHGKFGEVLECRHKSTGYLYALKKVFKSTIEEYQMHEQLLIELECMKRMEHPNIVKSYTAFTDQYHIFVLLEFAYGEQLIKKFNCGQEQVSKIIFQVLEALKYMHGKKVVHRDLKPENIIIDESGTIKICDFGWASLIQDKNNEVDQEAESFQHKMDILCGTLDYVCPQMVTKSHYTKEVDLWSVGVLAYELLFGVAPFKGENKSATFSKVKDLQYNFPGAYRFSGDSMDFISRLLKPETQRMRIEQCLNHPFIRKHQKQETKSAEVSEFQEIMNIQ